MKAFLANLKKSSRVYPVVLAALISGLTVLASGAIADQVIPWPEQPKVLQSEIQSYVDGSIGPLSSKVRPGSTVGVLFLGYSQEAISRNAGELSEIDGYSQYFTPYGRTEYYTYPFDFLQYQQPDTITVLNVDLTKETYVPEFTAETDIKSYLDPDGLFIQDLGKQLYGIMNIMAGSGTVTELGTPMKKFTDEEFTVRHQLFDTTCTSVTEFVQKKTGKQHHSMFVYTDYEPGSDEQIACLAKHILIFTRPATLPFAASGTSR